MFAAGRLFDVKRIASSKNGNPNFIVRIDGKGPYLESYRTSNDAGIAYAITNFKKGTMVLLTLTPAHRITGMEEVNDNGGPLAE